MLAVGYLHLLGKVAAVVEIAQHKSCGAALHHAREEGHCLAYVRAMAHGMEVEHLAYDIEYVLASLLWRDILLYAVGEEYHSYLVVVLYCAEGDGCSHFCSHVRLHLASSAKVERTRNVDEEHDRKLTLLLEHLNEWFAETRCDIPIDITHIVAKLILAHFGKSHTPTLEGRVVLSGEYVLAQSACLDFYLANLF